MNEIDSERHIDPASPHMRLAGEILWRSEIGIRLKRVTLVHMEIVRVER